MSVEIKGAGNQIKINLENSTITAADLSVLPDSMVPGYVTISGEMKSKIDGQKFERILLFEPSLLSGSPQGKFSTLPEKVSLS